MAENGSNPIAMIGLMPHAPILIGSVGGSRGKGVEKSAGAMRQLSRRMIEPGPARLVLISPHSPRRPGAFGVWETGAMAGSLDQFGSPEVGVSLPNDPPMAAAIKEHASKLGLSIWSIRAGSLDHGALVPLHFLTEAGWSGPTTVLGLNYPGEGGLRQLGQCLANAASTEQGPVMVLASGDMSHRLQPGAPAGYDPTGQVFDESFVRLLRERRYEELERLDPALVEAAGEDVVDSTLVAMSSVGFRSDGGTVLSYEGPYGVGYCVALLYEAGSSKSGGASLPAWARRVVTSRVLEEPDPEPLETDDYLNRQAGVFVTIRTRDGDLRGCRGTIRPQHSNLVEETRAVAVSSALCDGRFSPIQAHELEHLAFEVSVLHQPEPVESMEQLDPAIYGVIVSVASGRCGLMLPEVEGLETAASQIEATRRKSGIDPGEPVRLERFRVDKFKERGETRA